MRSDLSREAKSETSVKHSESDIQDGAFGSENNNTEALLGETDISDGDLGAYSFVASEDERKIPDDASNTAWSRRAKRRLNAAVIITVWGTVAAALMLIAARLIIFFMSDAVRLFSPDIGAVLSSFKTAEVRISIHIPLICGLCLSAAAYIIFAASKRLKKGAKLVRVICEAIAVIVLFFAGIALTLIFSEINSIPIRVLIPIITDAVGAVM